jgi:D-alanyl-lipoteichoic acid acyltransferase DltB (MBOAT superfamily)
MEETLFQGACYVLLFVICVAIFAKMGSRGVRQTILLFASFALYLTWVPWFAGVLITSIVVNFLIGRWVRRNPSWAPLALGVIFNLALLSAFKYLPELAVHIRLDALQSASDLALLLGISLLSFPALTYLFDQYRGEGLIRHLSNSRCS